MFGGNRPGHEFVAQPVSRFARPAAKAVVELGQLAFEGVAAVQSKPHQPPFPQQLAIVPSAGEFSHGEACRIADLVLGQGRATTVVIDLKNAAEATTSAFARLVLLRRLLLKSGRDLRLVNLRDRAASLYHINHLSRVLPCA